MCGTVCGMLKCYRIIKQYGTRILLNELDIKECIYDWSCKQQYDAVAHFVCWFNEWYTRFSGIEGQVNDYCVTFTSTSE